MHGFGPVEREADEPTFHAAWEARMHALTHLGFYNGEEFRSGIERMDPVAYLAASYYERWIATTEANLIEKGVLTREEIEARHALYAADPARPVPRNDDPAITAQAAARRRSANPPDPDPPPPRFAEGDAVRARNVHPIGHTRLPRYVRGKRGTIASVRTRMIFPDTHFGGHPGDWQWVYTVRFAARELWGDAADPKGCLHIDLWEAYLDPV
jgi:nitrile hydratase